jgi:hypothetical protein
MAWRCDRAGSAHQNREMGSMSRTIVVVSALAVTALAALPTALDGEGRDSGPRADQATRTVYRGGWDGNGPDLFGTVEEDRDPHVLYRVGRGGWDGNGPDALGARLAETTAAGDLDRLVLQAVELPNGELIGVAKD